MTQATDPAATYDYTYDNLGRATAISHDLAALTATISMAQSFNANSGRTQLAATIGSTADFVTDYSYDALQRMTRIEQQDVGGGNAVADKRIDLAYNSAGQFSSISRYANLSATQLVASSTYGYDSAGRLTSLTHTKGGTTLADYDWTYDVGNRLTQFVSLTDGTVDYSYDARQQLTGANYDYQTDESFTYDDNGNRTNTGYSTGDENRLLSDGTFNYLYDDEGNRIKKTDIASGAYTEYSWDQRNRLIQVVHKDSSGTVLQTLDYTYDLFDRRIGKVDTPPVGPAFTEQFVYDGEHVALRFEGGQLSNRYLHGPAVDQILADEQVSSPSTAGDVLWPLTDNLGTVRDLGKYNSGTDVTSIANHIAYDAFGQRTSETNSAVDHLFGYTGRDWDEDADLQYNRARWYDPATGRWMSQDPIGFNAGDANLFRYVENGPTTRRDPSGLWTWSELGDAFVQSYGEFVNPWDGAGPPPVDWVDQVLTTGTQAGQATAVIAGAAAGGIAVAGAAGVTAGGAAAAVGTEIVDTAIEEAATAVAGFPVFIPVSPLDIVQDGGKLICKNAVKQGLAPVKAVHKNSLDYVGDTHVYRVRGPEGTHKIGESAQGVRLRDVLQFAENNRQEDWLAKPEISMSRKSERPFLTSNLQETTKLDLSNGFEGYLAKTLYPEIRQIDEYDDEDT